MLPHTVQHTPLVHRRSIQTVFLFLAVVALAACAASAGTYPLPPAQACVVEHTTSPLGEDILKLKRDQSPPYCSGSEVQKDFEETMEWYRTQFQLDTCPPQNPPTAYPATLVDALPTYYTGELLHDTRETIYHNQQAGRLVVGCWDWKGKREVIGPEWSEDGRTATLWWKVQDYHLLTYDVQSGAAVLIEADDDDDTSSSNGNWEATMVYDEGDGRWKIMRARNTAY